MIPINDSINTSINNSINISTTPNVITTLPQSTSNAITALPQFSNFDLFGAIIVICVFAIFIGVIYFYEIDKAYAHCAKIDKDQKAVLIQSLTKNMDNLVAKATQPTTQISLGDLSKFNEMTIEIKKLIEDEPIGIPGFTRGQIAITVIFLLGTAVILVTFSSRTDTAIVNNVLSMLGATLAAVVGFYFGGKKE